MLTYTNVYLSNCNNTINNTIYILPLKYGAYYIFNDY